MMMARERWTSFSLQVNESSFSLSPPRLDRGLALPMTGADVDVTGGPAEYEAKLKWLGGHPRMEREVKGGGKVGDTFELLAPDQLQVTRSFTADRQSTDLRFLYNRGSD